VNSFQKRGAETAQRRRSLFKCRRLFAFLPGPRHFSPPLSDDYCNNSEQRRIAMEKLQPSTALARLFQKEFSQQQHQLLLSAGEKNECRGGECSARLGSAAAAAVVACFFFRMQIDACRSAKTQGKFHPCVRRRRWHHIFFLIMCGGCKGAATPPLASLQHRPEVQYQRDRGSVCLCVPVGIWRISKFRCLFDCCWWPNKCECVCVFFFCVSLDVCALQYL
jgi:hypothetical protein